MQESKPTTTNQRTSLEDIFGTAQAPANRPALSSILGTGTTPTTTSSSLGDKLLARGKNMVNDVKGVIDTSKGVDTTSPVDTALGSAETGLKTAQLPIKLAGEAGGAVMDVAGSALKSVGDATGLTEPAKKGFAYTAEAIKKGYSTFKSLPEPVQNALFPSLHVAGQALTPENIDMAKNAYNALPEDTKKVLGSILDATNLIGLDAIGTQGVKGLASTPALVRDFTVGTKDMIANTTKKGVNAIADNFSKASDVLTSPEVHPFVARSPQNAQLVTDAVKQGFEPKDIKFLTTVAESDKPAIQEMINLAETGSKDLRAQYAGKRPIDVVGDSVVKPLREIQKVNETAGQAVDSTARSLAGQTVNAEPVYNTTKTLLTRAGAKVNANGVWNFQNSIFKKSPELVRQIENALSDVPTGIADAYDVHKFKKSIDQIVEYGRNKGELTGDAESILKQVRASADDVLDTNFPDYNKANTDFKTTRDLIDRAHEVMGAKTDFLSGNANMRVGQATRQLFNNTTKRGEMFTFLQELKDTAGKYGIDMSSNPVDQAVFAQVLESVYGTPAITGLQGEVGKALKTAMKFKTNPIGASVEAVGNAIEKMQNITPEEKKRVLQELMKPNPDAGVYPADKVPADMVPPADRPYAEQKTGLLPDEFINDKNQ